MKKVQGYFLRLAFFISTVGGGFPVNAQISTTRNLVDSLRKDGEHDFDFEIGEWKTKLSVLKNPLSGGVPDWIVYEGVSSVKKIVNGKGNFVELIADGVAGHFEGVSLRLYNPQSKQWSLHFANIRNGIMSLPVYGAFTNDTGEFYNQEFLANGQAIFVKFVIMKVNENRYRFEQYYSADGGKTWELNWIATDTRIKP